MRPFQSLSLALSAVALAVGLAAAPLPASAQALRLGAQPASVATVAGGDVQQVQWRGGPGGPGWGGGGWRGGGPGWGGGGWAGRPGWGGGWGPGWGRPGWGGGPVYYGGGWGYGYGPYYGGWNGFGPGLATGIIVGAAVANTAPVYGGPVYVGAPANWIAYCSRKYRSFDPRTGTFLGYDGRRHPCT